MATTVFLVFCACVVAAVAQLQPSYTTKYDNLDLDKILTSKRLVNNYVQCLTDKKPCSPEGSELKKVLPDAIRTKCVKCTDTQREKAVRVVRKLQKDYPQEWKVITDKWDPSGNLMKEFEEEIAKKQG